jgi:hypothetical protein
MRRSTVLSHPLQLGFLGPTIRIFSVKILIKSMWEDNQKERKKVFNVKTFFSSSLMLCGLYYKQVTIVIYNRNDIGLYYKTRDDRN